MIQQPLTQQRKSSKLAITYICLLAFAQLSMQLICFPFFTVESLQFLKTVTVVSLLILTIFGFLTWYRGPGYIESDT